MKRSVTHIILKNIDKTKQYIFVKYPWVFSLFFCVSSMDLLTDSAGLDPCSAPWTAPGNIINSTDLDVSP